MAKKAVPKQNIIFYVLIGVFCAMLYFILPQFEVIHAMFLYAIVSLGVYLIIKRERRPETRVVNPLAENYKKKLKKAKQTQQRLSGREKKMLIFHILTQVEKQESIEMKDISEEFSVGKANIDEIVRFLDSHKVVTVLYLPMGDFPVIRRGDNDLALRYKTKIYRSLSKADSNEEPNFEAFSREVSSCLEAMRRDLAGKK